ncbi:hypothetical protein Tco_1556491 [Tanacetum coccineum]
MSYPRFTKIIIDYFMSNDQSISRRNNMFWHTTRDDTMFASIRCISRHEVPRPEKAPNQSTSKMKVIPDTNHAGGKNLFKLLTSSQASGSGDGVDTQSKFLPCALATNRLLVQMKEMLDVDDANDDDKQEGEDMNNDDEETDKEEEEYDDEFNIEEDEKMDEEEDDELTKKWYKDVNINLGNKDANMTDVDQGGAYQQNVSQQSGFNQEEEDAHVTLTHNNPSPADNEIASLMDTTSQHATIISEITSSFTTTVPPLPPFFNHLQLHFIDKDAFWIFSQDEKNAYIELIDTSIRALIKEEVNTQLPLILPQAVSSSQPTSTYEAAASLSAFKITKILIDKIEKNKSHDKADYKKKLYDALVESYNTDKDLFDSYGKVFSLKRSRDDSDKDRDPSAGSDRGKKRRKSSKDVESSRDSRSKEKKSSSTSKDASQSQHKSSGKSANTEEPSYTVEDSGMQQDQEFITGDNNEQPVDKETWISQVAHAEEPPTSFDELNDTSFDFSAFVINQLKIPNLTQKILVGLAFNLLKGTCKSITELEYHLEEYLEYLKGGDLSRRYSSSVTKTKVATYELKWIEDLVPELWSPVHNLTSSKDVYSRRRIIAVTRNTIMKMYDYGYLEEIEVCRDDQKLYTFKEGDFKRLRLQDIEDMLLLLVQQKLTNLTIDERHDLNVALRMYTKHIVIQRRVKDLQLGVESYQKKLNLTKPDTYRLNLRNKTAYTSHSDPHGIIYVDQFKRKRLMRADELHKFIDDTLNDVRTALHDIAAGIRMEYMPMRKWSNLDKKRARVMVQYIDKQLYQRRLMRNLEKFIGGREYGKDLRLLERTI